MNSISNWLLSERGKKRYWVITELFGNLNQLLTRISMDAWVKCLQLTIRKWNDLWIVWISEIILCKIYRFESNYERQGGKLIIWEQRKFIMIINGKNEVILS